MKKKKRSTREGNKKAGKEGSRVEQLENERENKVREKYSEWASNNKRSNKGEIQEKYKRNIRQKLENFLTKEV